MNVAANVAANVIVSTDRYRVRLDAGKADLRAAQNLRHRCFFGAPFIGVAARQGTPSNGYDTDPHDALCRHVLVEDIAAGRLVCCFRFLPLQQAAMIETSYAAQRYDLSSLRGFSGPLVEIGRFCIDPCVKDPDVMRLAWGALARLVEDCDARILFGCASFRGTDAGAYRDAFALLSARHLGPAQWRPGIRAPQVHRFADATRGHSPDLRRAMRQMPPLLRFYLAMGGWVGDHAVVDHQMDTLHVFTALQVDAVPAARARVLRSVAGCHSGAAGSLRQDAFGESISRTK